MSVGTEMARIPTSNIDLVMFEVVTKHISTLSPSLATSSVESVPLTFVKVNAKAQQ